MAASGAGAKNAHFAVGSGQRTQHARGFFEIAHRLIVRDASRGAHFGGHILGDAVSRPEIQVRAEGGIALPRKLQGDFLVPLIPAGHVVGQNHPRKGSGAQRPGKIGIDPVAMKALDHDRFGQQAFVHICLVHAYAPSLRSITLDSTPLPVR